MGKLGSHNGRQEAISESIRRVINSGALPPGSRLPLRSELIRIHRTTPVTVQRALNKLLADGFVRSAGMKGTFVADHPPCLFRFAVVFYEHLEIESPGNTFSQVLARAAKRAHRVDGTEFSLYMGLDGHTDEPDYRRLSEDLRMLRIAGLIFASSPHLLRRTPLFKWLLARKDLPKVAFMSNSAYPEISAVWHEGEDFLRKSLDHLRGRGRRRLAVIKGATAEKLPHAFDESSLTMEAARRGMELRPEWLQSIHWSVAWDSRNLTRLLLGGRPGERPDALLLTDSVFAEPATAAVRDMGLDSGTDLTVVSHCNFPETPATSFPVTFVGIDVERALEVFLEAMRTMKSGAAAGLVPPLRYELREHTAEPARISMPAKGGQRKNKARSGSREKIFIHSHST